MRSRGPDSAWTKREMRARGGMCLAFAAGLAAADVIIVAICLTPTWSLHGVLTPLAVVFVIPAMTALVGGILRTAGAAGDVE